MITVPLTARDVLIAAQVGLARALEALDESCDDACEPRHSIPWDRMINAAIIDYAQGTLKDRYWPGPLPDPYYPHDFVPVPPLANARDLAAEGEPMANDGARLRLPGCTDRPVLVVEIDLHCALACCPAHGCAARGVDGPPASHDPLGGERQPAAEQREERDARLFRKWIDTSNSRIYYWPGYAWGRAALTGPA